MSIEETEALKATVVRLKEEKEELDDKLIRAIQEKNTFRREVEDKDRIIRELRRGLKFEKATRLRVGEALVGADSALSNKDKEIRELEKRNGELHQYWELSCREETRLTDQLEAERQEFQEERQELQQELESEEQKRLELKEEYENFLLYERDVAERDLAELQDELNQGRRRIEDLESTVDFFRTHAEEFRQSANEESRRFENLVKYIQKGEPYQMLCDDRDYWKRRSDRFAAIAHGMIDEILVKLEAANEAMMPQETPDDVQKFLDCCNNLVRELKRRIRGR